MAYIALGRLLQKSGYMGVPVANTLSNGKKIVELVGDVTGDVIRVRYAPNFVGSQGNEADSKRLNAAVSSAEHRVKKDEARFNEAKQACLEDESKIADYLDRIAEQEEIVKASNESMQDAEKKVLANLEANLEVTKTQAARNQAVLDGTEKELGDSELALIEAKGALEAYVPKPSIEPVIYEIDTKANADLLISL